MIVLAARGLLAACLLLTALQTPVLRFDSEAGAFRLEGWAGAGQAPADALPDILSVSVDATDVPPMIGSYSLNNGAVIFTPQFPLQPGMRYRAVARIPGAPAMDLTVDVPRPIVHPVTIVEQVYPSTDVLPENQLKFYIHFSRPMSRGEAYRHIRLLDEAGRPVQSAFLELGEELWDAQTTRFTLFFDPGRIKRGLVPNAELGVALQEGNTYTLVIDAAWNDADGAPLASGFRKTFRAAASERRLLDPNSWTMPAPRAGTTSPLTVTFPRPMDRALLQRELTVVDAAGAAVPGAVQIGMNETQWSFAPSDSWKAGAYSLNIGPALADLAGNMVDRPFEIDLFEELKPPEGGFIRSLPLRIE